MSTELKQIASRVLAAADEFVLFRKSDDVYLKDFRKGETRNGVVFKDQLKVTKDSGEASTFSSRKEANTYLKYFDLNKDSRVWSVVPVSSQETSATYTHPALSDYASAKAHADKLNEEMTKASDRLQAFPSGAMGLTPDSVRSTPEFKKAKADFDKAFAACRAFNAVYVKKFKKERNEDRKRKYATQSSTQEIKVTFHLKDLSDEFYNGFGESIKGLMRMTDEEKFKYLNKTYQQKALKVKMKIGTGQFKDAVDLNSMLRGPCKFDFKLEPRVGYKLVTFYISKA